jgi:integrase
MSAEQVGLALSSLWVRERAFCRLAIYAGMRPGEIIALKWSDVKDDLLTVDDRVYKGVKDEPKNRKSRNASLSPSVLGDLKAWRKVALDSEYILHPKRSPRPSSTKISGSVKSSHGLRRSVCSGQTSGVCEGRTAHR